MDARAPAGGPARWTRPFVKLDALWTRIETAMVVTLLLGAILYMAFWVTLNAFHTKGGKLAPFPGGVLLFAGVASGISWALDKNRKPIRILLPIVLLVVGALLFSLRTKTDYFANVARWLAEASILKQMGTPTIVSARLFTIWVALLGGSLATSAGRQINIDVLMRFIGPKPRLFVVLASYVATAFACFVLAWGFLDYLAVTRYAADPKLEPSAKIALVAKATRRHFFLARRQLMLDARSLVHVVFKGEPMDKWYKGTEWNEEVNTAGWATYYPPDELTVEEKQALPENAPPFPTTPCLSTKEAEALFEKGGSFHPKWKLLSACDTNSDANSTRPPFASAPEPDDRAPLEADLGLLFPFGFCIIGLRFLLRGLLAVGGAVSTDPNAAHGADVPAAAHGPLVEPFVDDEAKAHEGASALPIDDLAPKDVLEAESVKLVAAEVDAAAKARGEGGEAVHPHVVAEPPGASSRPTHMNPDLVEKVAAADEERDTAPPPADFPTAQKLEAAARAAAEDEDERTLVGDLSQLAKAQEFAEKMRESEKKAANEKADKSAADKKGGK